MWTETDLVPDLGRQGVRLVLVGEWRVRRGEQRRAADAVMAAWHEGAPPAGLRAYHCLLGEDGEVVLSYQQWTNPEASRAFVAGGRSQWLHRVEARVSGTDHQRITAYRGYRSTRRLDGAPPAGCLATVTVDFDGPDQQRQRAWIDGVFAASGTDRPAPATGLIAAHFHVSLDGTRVLNLAEWSSATAHRNAALTPAPRLRAATQRFPGVAASAIARYRPYRALTPSAG